MSRSLALSTLCLALPAPTVAQESTPLLRENDLVGGVPVRLFQRAGIADDGSWLGVVHENTPQGLGILLRDGQRTLREGDRLTSPSAQVVSIVSSDGAGGNVALHVTLSSFVPPRPGPIGALLRGDRVLVITNDPIDASGLPSGTVAGPIDSVAANASDTVMAVVGIGAGDRALVRFTFAADGSPLAREALLASGQVLPDGTVVDAIGRPAVDEDGAWQVRVVGTDGSIHLLSSRGEVLRTGSPSPLPGRSIASVSDRHDTNAFGGSAVAAALSGDPASNQVLLVNGRILAREGDLVPSLDPTLPPRLLAAIGHVELSNSGSTYWQALTAPGAFSSGSLLRDGVPFLEPGVSRVQGELVTFLEPTSDNFAISANGRFWLGRVVLESSAQSYLRIDFGASVPVPGCQPNPGTLRHVAGLVLAGHTVRLVLDGPAPLGSIAMLHVSTAPAVPGSPCGIVTPFGELLIDPSRRLFSLPVGIHASNPVTVDVTIPPDPSLVDRAFHAQGSFHGSSIVLTNALHFEIGAP